MTLQKLLSLMRKACDDQKMIADGEKIAVGLSGGKDSLALLTGLAAFRRFSPARFELCAVTVDLGFGADYGSLKQYCASLDVPFHLVKTEIAQIIFEARKEKNPCSLCSKMRRGALNTFITQNGYHKLALGHHADDLAETLLLSLFYEGRLSTFAPVSFMDRSGVTLIRPLVYVFERDIAAFAKSLPVAFNPCPVNHETQREYMKNLIKSICKDIPFAKDRILGAITHPERNNLWKPDL
ncbi:MAG: tRNA 2-thiocytidine biosynthesis TtcA family protein [Firmicutes bacterium]|nr:tRNA 2-thiocytidine biosynthesis TtcA family protein [Bacillota bacterium]